MIFDSAAGALGFDFMSCGVAPQHKAFGRLKNAARAFALTLSLLPLCGAPAMASDPATQVDVTLDRAKLVKLPPHVDTIVVGNPSIADVTMIKRNGLLVVTGKGFGETNVIFLDAAGQALSEAVVTVRASKTLLTVQRGMDRESYSCSPRCEPTVALGDAQKFLSEASGQITARNSLVAPSAAH